MGYGVTQLRTAIITIQFDYRVMKGKEAAYRVEYDDPGKTILSYDVPGSDKWKTQRKILSVPQGATKMRIRLLAFPNETRPTLGVARFDDLKVALIADALNPLVSLAPKYEMLSIPKSTESASYTDSKIPGSNLIPNPSFEAGTWTEAVGDCNAYDANPIIGMKLATSSKSDGKASLELSAKRHIACTGTKQIDIKEGHKYLLSFDYQSPNSGAGGYAVRFNDPEDTALNEINKLIPTKEWQTYKKTFTVPYGASKATISVFANSDEDAINKTVVNRYDNFRLIEVPDIQGQYYAISGSTMPLQSPTKTDYTLVNPTKKLIHITGAKTPFYLSMSEAFHPQWRLELNNGKVQGINSWVPTAKPNAVAADQHFKLDDFLNGWYVDPAALCKQNAQGCKQNADGSYDLEMVAEFTPQRWFYVGGIVSATTLAVCLGYLGTLWYRKRRRLTHNSRVVS